MKGGTPRGWAEKMSQKNCRSRAEFSNHGCGATPSLSLEQASAGPQTLSLFKHGGVLESF